MIYPPAEVRKTAAEPDPNYISSEMKRKYVTLMLLWEEYKRDNPDGLMYTQFCERYRSFKKSNQISLHIEHKAGEEMQVDWAGSTIPYTESSTGEEKDAYLFVSVLPDSAYPFAYAYGDRKQPNWIGAHVRAFEHYGGVPRVISFPIILRLWLEGRIWSIPCLIPTIPRWHGITELLWYLHGRGNPKIKPLMKIWLAMCQDASLPHSETVGSLASLRLIRP